MVGVAGSVDPPAQVLLCCTCVGPLIVLDQTEVRAMKYGVGLISIHLLHILYYPSIDGKEKHNVKNSFY